MTPATLSEEEIFQVARRIDSAEARRAYVDETYRADATLRQQVESLSCGPHASGKELPRSYTLWPFAGIQSPQRATLGAFGYNCQLPRNLSVLRCRMHEITRILSAIEQGDQLAAAQLLPLVYDELRKLAAHKLAQERPGQTLQATALVHDAYLRLVNNADELQWNSRGHFFGAAAVAIRRILVENARRKARVKHGGDRSREELMPSEIVAPEVSEDLLALDEALDRLAEHDPPSAELVKLRYFAGLTIPQVAEVMGISPRKADLMWSFARAWLRKEIEKP